jgi:exodeoxyribonuclease V alpha subunit
VRREDPTTIEGILERILYANDETAWSVVHVRVEGERDPVSATGNLLGVRVGERIRLSGTWEHNKKFGRQFKVDSYLTVRPTTKHGIEKYLASGLVEGIGPAMAERIVAHFGDKTLDVLEQTPQRLTEVEGIGPVRAARIDAAWAEQRAIKDVMIFLGEFGVTPAYAVRIFKRYGDKTIATVRSNPYQLALDIAGIGFKKADAIALRLGLDRRAPARVEAGALHALMEGSSDGHVYLPAPELAGRAAELLGVEAQLVDDAITTLIASRHVRRDGDAIYLTPLYDAELEAAQALLHFGPDTFEADVDQVIAAFEQDIGITLGDAQRDAVHAARTNRLLVITGGPGTGKTTLLRAILRLYETQRLQISLAAPTGRAAKRMHETTGIEAKTIHRLLEFAPEDNAFVRNDDNPLETDVLIVDEASMLDVALLADLMRAVPRHARVVFVGDVDQLPSVGPGNVLGDIIDSGRATVVRLEQIFRQASASRIVTNAHRIIHGEPPDIRPAKDELSDFYFIRRERPDDVLDAIDKVIAERIPKRFGLDPVDDVQVLTPMHRGPLGGAAINRRLQALLNPRGAPFERGQTTYRVGDKVMQTKNDYELGVFNGDLGRIASVDEEEGTVDVVYDGRRVRYERRTMDALVLAYACTIHKSQGSEYPAVVLPVSTQHYVMLHRNLLYTGVTRGKRLVVLVGSERALRLAVDNRRELRRYSGLAERLKAASPI